MNYVLKLLFIFLSIRFKVATMDFYSTWYWSIKKVLFYSCYLYSSLECSRIALPMVSFKLSISSFATCILSCFSIISLMS